MSVEGTVRKKGFARWRRSSLGGKASLMVFWATIFVSAALLFLIEPMFAKFLLPSFGGAPTVWTGSMLFTAAH